MKRLIGIVTGLLVVASMSATPAYAISISLDDGINPIVVCADGAGCDLNPLAGAVTFIGAVGNFNLNVTTGITYPQLGTSADPQIDLNSVDLSSSGGGTLTILVSEIGYSGPTSSFNTAVGGTTSGTVNFASFLDDSNTLFGTASSLGTLGPFSSGAFSGSTSGGTSATDPFSLTLMATITHGSGSNNTSFNSTFNATTVPEPASLLLLGSGLLGLAFWGRKRFITMKD